MGRREWENGELTFGVKEFSVFRKELVAAMNVHQAQKLTAAQGIYADLIAAEKSEAKEPLKERVKRRLEALPKDPYADQISQKFDYKNPAARPTFSGDDIYEIKRALLPDLKGEPRKLRRPTMSLPVFQPKPLPAVGSKERPQVRAVNAQRKAFYLMARDFYEKMVADTRPTVSIADKFRAQWQSFKAAVTMPNYESMLNSLAPEKPRKLARPTEKSFPPYKANATQFSARETTLSIDLATRKVTWEVSETKSAVEEAWATVLGRAFNTILESTVWSKGAGGRFWGGDEYQEDADREHGQGSGGYTTRTYPREPSLDLSSGRRYRY